MGMYDKVSPVISVNGSTQEGPTCLARRRYRRHFRRLPLALCHADGQGPVQGRQGAFRGGRHHAQRALRRPVMPIASPIAARRAARGHGIATLELAIVLPLLALLLFMLVDLSRAIQAKTILLNISREGANLSARATADLTGSSQSIMNALAATTPPLDMPARGMIYITKIMGSTGVNGSLRNIVLEQYRWNAGAQRSGYQPASQVWQCGNWNAGGACGAIGKSGSGARRGPDAGPAGRGRADLRGRNLLPFRPAVRRHRYRRAEAPLLGSDLYAMTVF